MWYLVPVWCGESSRTLICHSSSGKKSEFPLLFSSPGLICVWEESWFRPWCARGAGGWGGWYILSPAGFTQSKKLVSTEGNLRTHVLNLQMIKLSPREEAGFAEVIAGIMQAAIPVSRILGYCCFPCLLCHISCLKAFDSTLNGGSSMLTPHIIS